MDITDAAILPFRLRGPAFQNPGPAFESHGDIWTLFNTATIALADWQTWCDAALKRTESQVTMGLELPKEVDAKARRFLAENARRLVSAAYVSGLLRWVQRVSYESEIAVCDPASLRKWCHLQGLALQAFETVERHRLLDSSKKKGSARWRWACLDGKPLTPADLVRLALPLLRHIEYDPELLAREDREQWFQSLIAFDIRLVKLRVLKPRWWLLDWYKQHHAFWGEVVDSAWERMESMVRLMRDLGFAYPVRLPEKPPEIQDKSAAEKALESVISWSEAQEQQYSKKQESQSEYSADSVAEHDDGNPWKLEVGTRFVEAFREWIPLHRKWQTYLISKFGRPYDLGGEPNKDQEETAWEEFEEEVWTLLGRWLPEPDYEIPRLLYLGDGENEPLLIDDGPDLLRDEIHASILILQEVEKLFLEVWESADPDLDGERELARFLEMACFWNMLDEKEIYEYLVAVPHRRLRRLDIAGRPLQPKPRPAGLSGELGIELTDAIHELDRLRAFLDRYLRIARRQAGDTRPEREWSEWVQFYSDRVLHLGITAKNGDLRSGTAFLCGKRRFATCRHNIVDHDRVQVYLSDNEPEATTVQLHPTADVATFSLPEQLQIPEMYLPARNSLPSPGEEVAALGYARVPLTQPALGFYRGYVEACPTGYSGSERFIQTSIQTSGGLSGGPVIDRQGRVVGVVSERTFEEVLDERIPSRPFALAVPISNVLELLDLA